MNIDSEMTYTITLHREDDGGVWAEVMELPGCFAAAHSMEELPEVLADAIQLYISSDMAEAQVNGLRLEPMDVSTPIAPVSRRSIGLVPA